MLFWFGYFLPRRAFGFLEDFSLHFVLDSVLVYAVPEGSGREIVNSCSFGS